MQEHSSMIVFCAENGERDDCQIQGSTLDEVFQGLGNFE